MDMKSEVNFNLSPEDLKAYKQKYDLAVYFLGRAMLLRHKGEVTGSDNENYLTFYQFLEENLDCHQLCEDIMNSVRLV